MCLYKSSSDPIKSPKLSKASILDPPVTKVNLCFSEPQSILQFFIIVYDISRSNTEYGTFALVDTLHLVSVEGSVLIFGSTKFDSDQTIVADLYDLAVESTLVTVLFDNINNEETTLLFIE